MEIICGCRKDGSREAMSELLKISLLRGWIYFPSIESPLD